MKIELIEDGYIRLTPENRNDTYWLGIISQKISHSTIWAPEDGEIGCGLLEFKSLSTHKDTLVNYLVNSKSLER